MTTSGITAALPAQDLGRARAFYCRIRQRLPGSGVLIGDLDGEGRAEGPCELTQFGHWDVGIGDQGRVREEVHSRPGRAIAGDWCELCDGDAG
jgi:catechol 2,3-dioxygenase-like lactoylglutathione lyase family enzyme